MDKLQPIVFFDLKNNEDYLNAQHVAFKYGYEWSGGGREVVDDYDEYEMSTLVFRKETKIITRGFSDVDELYELYVDERGYKGNEELLEKVYDINKLEIILSGFIDYNKPKKLVYESVDESKYYMMMFFPKSDEDLIESQKIGFENGYEYPGIRPTEIKHTKRSGLMSMNFNFETKRMTVSTQLYNINDGLTTICMNYHINKVNIIVIDNLKDLVFVLKYGKKQVDLVNYNEPKKLVYESKILKYNKFKNV